MTAFRLHIARISSPAQAVDEGIAVLAAVTPPAAVFQVTDMAAAWELAQFVDIVDAGYGVKDSKYRGASQALKQFVRREWQNQACRALCARSACLSNFVDQVLDAGAQANVEISTELAA
jgi:hypothetical protein